MSDQLPPEDKDYKTQFNFISDNKEKVWETYLNFEANKDNTIELLRNLAENKNTDKLNKEIKDINIKKILNGEYGIVKAIFSLSSQEENRYKLLNEKYNSVPIINIDYLKDSDNINKLISYEMRKEYQETNIPEWINEQALFNFEIELRKKKINKNFHYCSSGEIIFFICIQLYLSAYSKKSNLFKEEIDIDLFNENNLISIISNKYKELSISITHELNNILNFKKLTNNDLAKKSIIKFIKELLKSKKIKELLNNKKLFENDKIFTEDLKSVIFYFLKEQVKDKEVPIKDIIKIIDKMSRFPIIYYAHAIILTNSLLEHMAFTAGSITSKQTPTNINYMLTIKPLCNNELFMSKENILDNKPNKMLSMSIFKLINLIEEAIRVIVEHIITYGEDDINRWNNNSFIDKMWLDTKNWFYNNDSSFNGSDITHSISNITKDNFIKILNESHYFNWIPKEWMEDDSSRETVHDAIKLLCGEYVEKGLDALSISSIFFLAGMACHYHKFNNLFADTSKFVNLKEYKFHKEKALLKKGHQTKECIKSLYNFFVLAFKDDKSGECAIEEVTWESPGKKLSIKLKWSLKSLNKKSDKLNVDDYKINLDSLGHTSREFFKFIYLLYAKPVNRKWNIFLEDKTIIFEF